MGGNLVESNPYVRNGSWDELELLFEKFQKNRDSEIRIPKKIHQIWLGEMPEKHKKLIPDIIKNHPDWEYKLWSKEDIENIPMINKNLFDSLTNLGAKSDIARYEILHNEGGIYLDSDFFMVGNFEMLLSNDFFSGVGHSNEPMLFNGLIGCTKGHPLMHKILIFLRDRISGGDLSIYEIMSTTGPYFFSEMFFDYIKETKNEKIVVLPTPYFYSLPATERFNFISGIDGKENFIKSFIKDETICIHLWFTSWQ